MKIKFFSDETLLSTKQVVAGWILVLVVGVVIAAVFSTGALLLVAFLLFLLSAIYFGVTSESNHDPFEIHKDR